MNKWIVIVLIGLLVSCQLRETPIQPVERGDAAIVQIEMGSEYSQQIWFDLGNLEVVSTNARDAWELAFDCSDSLAFVHLNSGLMMQAAITDETELSAVTSEQGLDFKIDHPTGELDSLAMGKWWQHGRVVVLDLGVTTQGSPRGYRKMMVESLDNGIYTFHYANLDDSNAHTVQLEKDGRYNRIMYSLSDHEQRFIEPQKEAYDLVFRQYSHTFYNPYVPYSVNGVLINPSGVLVAEDSASSFADISRYWVDSYTFTDMLNVIGYDWKVYNFSTNLYELKPWKNFIVRDYEGYYYKIHFLDFYNNQGERGYPLMEVARL